VPEIRKLQKSKKRGSEILEPILKKCLAEFGSEKSDSHGPEDHQGTFFSW